MQSIEQIIKEYNRYVRVMASSFNQDEYFDDLVSAGNIGLWNAYQRYDPSHGKPFITYASIWVKREMMDFLTKYSRTIYLPANRVNEARNGSYYIITGTVSLNTPVGDSGAVLEDFVPDTEQEDQDDYASLKMALNRLKERDQELIKMYYGFAPYEEMNFKEIGVATGTSRQAAEEKIKRILKVLRNDQSIQQSTI